MDYIHHYQSSPVFRGIDVSHVPTAYFAKQYKELKTGWSSTYPEHEALKFYLGNQLVADLTARFGPYAPLPDPAKKAVADYADTVNHLGVKMFYYLLLICVRESRHAKTDDVLPSLKSEFGAACTGMIHKLKGCSGDHAYKIFANKAPATPIGNYCNYLVALFKKAKWSGGYGGDPWAEVAECLTDFVHGRTSLELMVDRAWALAHNNGPIFNKGLMFYMYNIEAITAILDVQRSGMLPGLIKHWKLYEDSLGFTGEDFFTDEISSMLSSVESVYEPDTTLCWFTVENLGAIGSYPASKATQVDMFGHPNDDPATKAKIEAAVKTAEAAKKKAAANTYEIMPGLTVQKVYREDNYGQAA